MNDVLKVKLDELVASADNPRKTAPSAADDAALAASISAHGLLQPLLVHRNEDGTYEVIEGNRRLRVLQGFSIAGLEVPVMVREDGQANDFEAATAANMMRSAMHPLDECEAISRLIGEDAVADVEAVAQRFGQTPTWVKQRLKLADLAPKVREAFRAGKFGLQTAIAFTLGPWNAQEKLLKQALADLDAGATIPADWIRRALTDSKIPASRAAFDLALYPVGMIERDLFSEDVWLLDREAFDKLQQAAFDATVEKLKGEGWGEVLAFTSREKFHEAFNKHVQVSGRIRKADRAKLVAMVTWNYQKTGFESFTGLASRQQAKALKKAAQAKDDTVAVEDVKPKLPSDLSKGQAELACEMMKRAVQEECAAIDTVALWTLIGAALGTFVPWSDAKSGKSYLLPEGPAFDRLQTESVPQSLADFEALPPKERMQLVRRAAVLLCCACPPQSVLKEWDLEGWFRPTNAFVDGWKLDQLRAYSMMIGAPTLMKHHSVKKIDWVNSVVAHCAEYPGDVIPPLPQFMGGVPEPEDDEDDDDDEDGDDESDAVKRRSRLHLSSEEADTPASPAEHVEPVEVPAQEE